MAKPKQNKAKVMKPEHIKFCQHYVEYGSAAQSYLYAYPGVTYGSARTLGSNLLTNVDVAEYIEQLKEEFAVQYNITREKLIRDLTLTAEESKKAFQFSATISALKEIARLAGLDVPIPTLPLKITSLSVAVPSILDVILNVPSLLI
jgi:phage terminase small subunit